MHRSWSHDSVLVMACAKPPNPNSRTEPSRFSHPIVSPVVLALKNAEARIPTLNNKNEIDAAIDRVERLLELSKHAGLHPRVAQKLRDRLEALRDATYIQHIDTIGAAHSPLATKEKGSSKAPDPTKFWEGPERRNTEAVIHALEIKDSWRSKEYTKTIISLIEQNSKIPQHYRDQLPTDVATVLRVCPNAGGLVKAMTLRGQGKPVASSGKLGSKGNAAIGSAYELMGTAELVRKVSKPVNGGPKLSINQATDDVNFGIKSHMNSEVNKFGSIEPRTRRTIESDLHIGRKDKGGGYREIGVDFKHSNVGVKYIDSDLKNQIENVAKSIRHGDIHEFHFVTNGKFGESVIKMINAANSELLACDPNLCPIACHERVTSA